MAPDSSSPTEDQKHELLAFATGIAERAGARVREGFSALKKIEHKGRIDLVTDTDLASERLILDALEDSYPGHTVIAEESAPERAQNAEPNASGYRWLIDPLDGTTNFAHHYPFVSVSMALQYDGVAEVGVVYDPLRDDCFTAARDEGACRNGEPIAVSSQGSLVESLIATGFPYDKYTNERINLENFAQVLLRVQGMRRAGSSALDCCHVAAGWLDGFWEMKLSPWDMAAGALIVREAGGTVTDFAGGRFDPFVGEIVATNGQIHSALVSLLIERPKRAAR